MDRALMQTNIFIQARMSSTRFPGKVLAPLRNKPIVKHLLDSVANVVGAQNIVVLTSLETSDDPLVAYLEKINCSYYRGNLQNVFNRFQSALTCFPCDGFVRLSADSPFISHQLISSMLRKFELQSCDIMSNVFVRTFPKGQSVEIIKTRAFLATDERQLTPDDREHVFSYFYREKHRYHIISVENDKDESQINMCVDTLQDLNQLSDFKCNSPIMCNQD